MHNKGFQSIAEGTRLLGLPLSWVLAELPLKELWYRWAHWAPTSCVSLCFCAFGTAPHA